MNRSTTIATLLTLAAISAATNSCTESQNFANSPAGEAPKFAPGDKSVHVWQQQVKIPTYLIGNPDPNPQFYLGGQSQGAQQRIYPYPSYDILTTDKVDKSYNMVYLENQYIKIGILPESGGRIFESLDKTNGYAFFYNQHVIKPALISLLGAWISGGVEWDIPHHHRATSFVPVQYTIEESPDGSKTVWVGELELRDQMLWTVGLTLHPGKNYLEASFRIANRTPVPTSMLCFSNVGVHAGVNYQIIFPPSTQLWTNHKKPYFQPWTEQLSWLKNHTSSGSWFAWNYTDDFMAGYDHDKHAGTMSIADHNVVPGKKFFTWGTQNTAEFNRLTDADGPYLELMVGAYSDNQPDYTWLAPFETRTWTQVWYPFRDIDGVKCANTEAAVNLEVTGAGGANGKIKLGFFSTSDRPNATVTLKLKDQTLLTETIAINPAKPYTKEISLPAGADEHDLRASLSDNNKELVAYSPIKLTPETPPTPVAANYGDPKSIKTNEELFLIGQRIEQFNTPYNPANPGTTINDATPETYWNEALARDPGDIRVNTAMGIRAIKGGRYTDAEKFLRTALARATDRLTTPKDGEPYYYLGLALKAQGKLDDAFTQFSHATWSGEWRNPGYYEMAEITSTKGDFAQALNYANQSLASNTTSIRALALRAAMLRHTGNNAEALKTLEALRAIDPLDVRALAEQWLTTKSPESAAALAKQVNILPTTALEVAGDFLNAGLWQDGSDFIGRAIATIPDPSKVSPLAFYYYAYFSQKAGKFVVAKLCYAQVANTSPEYAFPFQMELIPVLESAMLANPKDARAPYYLGNLLYDWQPDRALALWEKSAALGADFPVVYRNLAMVYTRQGNQREKVLAALEKGAQFGGNATIFDQLDRLYEENGLAPEKRLAIFQQHQAVIDRPEALSREINLAAYCNQPDLAISLIQSRFFRAWEGRNGYSMGDAWVNANIAAGNQRAANKQYKEALAAYQAALTLPKNLEEEGGGNIAPRRAEVSYYLGNTYDSLADATNAQKSWTTASTAPGAATPGAGAPGGGGGRGRGTTAAPSPGAHVAAADIYFQARALEKLGQPDRAKPLYQQLLTTSAQNLQTAPSLDSLTNQSANPTQRAQLADAHFLAGLGNLGLGNKDLAKSEFTTALKASPDHLAAKLALDSLK